MTDAELEVWIDQVEMFAGFLPPNPLIQQTINKELFKRHVALTKQVREIRDALSADRTKNS